jgi:hypothetical protein
MSAVSASFWHAGGTGLASRCELPAGACSAVCIPACTACCGWSLSAVPGVGAGRCSCTAACGPTRGGRLGHLVYRPVRQRHGRGIHRRVGNIVVGMTKLKLLASRGWLAGAAGLTPRPASRSRRLRPLPQCPARVPALRPGPRERLAHRDRRHRGSMPAPHRRPPRHRRRQMGPGRRRSHPHPPWSSATATSRSTGASISNASTSPNRASTHSGPE